jgi:polyisoprenyl-teichoic acid--peptidoglycan teichoic acid transferase
MALKNGILEFVSMDNFRKKRPGGTSAESSIIDGFIKRTPAPGNTPFKPVKPGAGRTLRVDDFRRPDGFIPRSGGGNAQIPDGTSLGRRTPVDMKLPKEFDQPKPKRKHKKHGQKKPVRKGLSMILTVGIMAAGFLVGFTYLRTSQVFEGGASALALECDVAPEQLTREGDGRVNILLLGKGGSGHPAPDLTDTLMIASVDTCQKEAALLSIPRDLYVQVPGNGSMKINSVYATYKQQALAEGKSNKQAEAAGIEAIENTMENVTSLPINYHAMVDFNAFRKAIDTVGGITINAKEPLYDATVAWENNGSATLAVQGINNFNGKQALLYARSRHGSSDFARSERQRQILVALREKAFSLGTFGNPIKMAQLFNAFGSHVRTNLSIDDVMKLYEIAQDIEGDKVTSVGLSDPPNNFVTTANMGGLSVVIPRAGLYQYADMQAYIRNALKDGFIRKENPQILVLNGTTTTGKATQYKEVLESYGYSVIGVGDAPTRNYQNSLLVDMSGGKKRYTQRYLELRLGTSATGTLPSGVEPGLADFVIIVGQNETGT